MNEINVLLSKLAVLLALLQPVAKAEVIPPPVFTDQASLRSYVVQMADFYGASESTALYIFEHETQDCFRSGYFEPDINGDNGESVGCWQIHLKDHPDVTPECAANFICATRWAMPQIAKNPNQWSTWKFRLVWYKDRL